MALECTPPRFGLPRLTGRSDLIEAGRRTPLRQLVYRPGHQSARFYALLSSFDCAQSARRKTASKKASFQYPTDEQNDQKRSITGESTAPSSDPGETSNSAPSIFMGITKSGSSVRSEEHTSELQSL